MLKECSTCCPTHLLPKLLGAVKANEVLMLAWTCI